ncbi:MAG: branched-chain amino acid ABC transporter permease [Alphaproteobacteria bacterium]|nr:branched-chain amino acid ABC transporter permease [Alphaproteobacteria bacterium]
MKAPHSGLVILGAILLVLPFLLPNSYWVDIVNRMAINAVVVLGLNLLMGYAGQVSLGHAGFFGIGAYASAILPTHFGWPPVAALGAGALGASALALVVARPIFRLRGHYLAMATLGLGLIIHKVLETEVNYSGGPDGMPVPPLSLAGFEISGERQWYWLLAALLLFSIWACQNLIDSPFGRALRGLHGSEVAARVAGVDVARYKMTIFVLSAFFASIMGSLAAHYGEFVSPAKAAFPQSIALVTMVVVGGMASIYGSVVGAVLLTGVPELLATFEGWDVVVFGFILVLSMIFMPRGLVPTLAAWRVKDGDNASPA